jgi:hypothetical protein
MRMWTFLKEVIKDRTVTKLIMNLTNFERILNEALARKSQQRSYRKEMDDLAIMIRPDLINTLADCKIVEKFRPDDFARFKKKYNYLLGKTQKVD